MGGEGRSGETQRKGSEKEGYTWLAHFCVSFSREVRIYKCDMQDPWLLYAVLWKKKEEKEMTPFQV